MEMHETPTMLPPRNDIRRHLDEDVMDEVMEGVMDGTEKIEKVSYDAIEGEVVPKSYGNWKLYEFDRDGNQRGRWFVGTKQKGLDLIKEMYGPLGHNEENSLLTYGSWMPDEDTVFAITCYEYKPGQRRANMDDILDAAKKESVPGKKLQASDEEDQMAEQFLERVEEAKEEAYEAFLQEDYMQQEAAERQINMDQLWDEVGKTFTDEYWSGQPVRR